MKKRILSVICTILLFSILFSIVGCNSKIPAEIEESTEAPTESIIESSTEPITTEDSVSTFSKKTYNISNDLGKFKLIGRMQDVEGGVSCDFTASGIEFQGFMTGEVILSLSCDASTYFTVYVDGKRCEERFLADSNTSELVIAEFKGEESHHIRVLKQTEAQWSLAVLRSITVNGELGAAPENKELYIEFIGDSITSGYGNLGDPSSPNPGTAIWEDGTQTYAFLAAEALGADCSVVSCSGIGVDKGWTDFSMSDFYPKTSFYRDRNGADYSFNRIPDIVVINLGTNDASRGSTKEDFMAGVRELIEYVRNAYGADVPIVWAYNMMGAGNFYWTKIILKEMGGEQQGLYNIQLNSSSSGGGGHPDLETQKLAAEKLTQFIQLNVLNADA